MRVDAHCHAVQERWHTEAWWQALAAHGADLLGVSAEGLRETVVPAYFDEDGSGQLGSMEEASIDVAVMFHYDWSLEPSLGRPEVGWREANDWYAGLAERGGRRIRWGFGVDPRQEGAREAFVEAVRDRGALCLKLHPAAGWRLDDRVAYPLLEAAGEMAVPVVLHLGPVPAPLDSRFSDPALLPKVAGDFPDLPMQAAHSGNEAWREVLEVAVSHSNVYCDLSGWQLRWMRDPGPFYADVRAILKGVGAERVMWGTDAPYFRPVAPDARWVEAFVDAPDGAFTPDEVEAILGGTATAFFGLA